MQQMRHKRDYLVRLKMVCDHLVGPGWFEFIPVADRDIIYEKRYPSLTVKIAAGSVVDPARWERYYEAMREMLAIPCMVDDRTAHIPLRVLLSEGLSLLHFVAMMAENRFTRSDELREVFRPYLMTERSYYHHIGEDLTQRLFMMDARSGNYHDGFLLADTSQTNFKKVRGTANTIFVHSHKPLISSIRINERKRDIIALSRPVPHGRTIQVSFKPSTIGLHCETDKALPVYLQRHAIDRLDERLGLRPDVVHSHLFFSLFEQPVKYVVGNDHTLIEFYMYEHKVGYLLTTLHDDKLVIRSFLFLTNDGTPEGKKLRKLTGLEKYDKKYLGIDKLSTFTAYRIHEAPELSELFRQAGCGSLLEAANLQYIASEYTPPRNKAMLHEYLNMDEQ